MQGEFFSSARVSDFVSYLELLMRYTITFATWECWLGAKGGHSLVRSLGYGVTGIEDSCDKMERIWGGEA